jgi:hypothetical protein
MHEFARQMRELGRKQSKIMRDQGRAAAMKRKEEYLGARVPKDLREKVIAKADTLGIPVSILIRNILEEAFKGQATHENGSAGQASTSAGTKRTVKFPDVIAWEAITLNKDIACSECSRVLAAGSVAAWGLGLPRENQVVLCEKCREYV